MQGACIRGFNKSLEAYARVPTQGVARLAYSSTPQKHLATEEGRKSSHVTQMLADKSCDTKLADLPTPSLQKEISAQDFFSTKAKEIEDRLSQGLK